MNNPRVDIYEKEYLRLIKQDKKINNLIKYLEDKIENERKIQKFLYENKNTKLVEKATTNSAIRTYQEILDKIRSDE